MTTSLGADRTPPDRVHPRSDAFGRLEVRVADRSQCRPWSDGGWKGGRVGGEETDDGGEVWGGYKRIKEWVTPTKMGRILCLRKGVLR